MTKNTFVWLTSQESTPFFEWTQKEIQSGRPEISLQKELRTKIGIEKAQAILGLLPLRIRGARKFPLAQHMFFTDESLQQATSLELAEFKAKRFPAEGRIQDWCCGIGGDLIALSGNDNPCLGIDQSESLCEFAKANLSIHTRSATIRCADVEDAPVESDDWIHADPARRTDGKRTTRLENYRPNETTLERAIRSARGTCLKLAPATLVPDSWRAEHELQWIGHQGECKQLLCWTGELAKHPGRRSVAIVEGGRAFELVESEAPHWVPSHRTQAGDFVFEPHSAVLAAKMVSNLAQANQIEILNSNPIMLTGEKPIASPFLRGFQVLQISSPQTAKLRKDIEALNPGHVEFKCRPPLDKIPNLEKKLRLNGQGTLTVIGLRFESKAQILICRRI